MAQVTFCFAYLLQQAYAQFQSKQQQMLTWDECCDLCLVAWTRALASLLDRAVFEEECDAESPSRPVQSLAKLVLCFVALSQHGVLGLTQEFIQEIMRLWHYYKRQRTVYLSAYDKDIVQDTDAILVENLLSIPLAYVLTPP